MDKKRGLINISVAIAFKFAVLISSLLVRRYLIRYIGDTANGLDSLYLSIIGFLSVAELGIGSAITFACISRSWKGITQRFRRYSAYFENCI